MIKGEGMMEEQRPAGAENSPNSELRILTLLRERLTQDSLGLNNLEIGERLGYKGGNIVPMWRSGRTIFPISQLLSLSELVGISLERLLPMWVEQQVDSKCKNKADEAIVAVAERVVTAEEYALVRALRQASSGDQNKGLTAADKDALLACLMRVDGQTGRSSAFTASQV